jgi:hypothetical protein
VIGLPALKNSGRRLAGGLLLTATAIAALIAAPAASAAPAAPGAQLSPATGNPSGKFTFSVVGATKKGADGRYAFAYNNIKPGSVIHDYVELYNSSSESGAMQVSGVDAIGTTATGSLVYDQATQTPKDLGTWETFYSSPSLPNAPHTSFIMGGGHGIIDPFTITVPLTAKPGDHTGGLSVQVGHQETTSKGEGITVYSRIVLPILIRVTGPLTAGLQIQSVSTSFSTPLNPFATAKASISYTVANVGNTRLSGTQVLQVSGLFGSTTIKPKLPMVLPGDSVRVTQSVSGLYPLGPYTAKVSITPTWPPSSGPLNVKLNTVAASASLFGLPWSLIVLILLLAGLGYATYRFLRWRVRQRAADMAAVAAAARKDAERAMAGKAAASAATPAAAAAASATPSGATATSGTATPAAGTTTATGTATATGTTTVADEGAPDAPGDAE